MHISKTGNSSFHISSHSFCLNHVLYVPQIQKKLLSDQKFYKDNNVYFEFHSQYFLVKGYSRIVLHRGHVSDRLYHFLPKNTPQSFSGVRISFDLWHRHIGHAASPVVHRVLTSNKLPVDKIKTNSVCPDCQLAKNLVLPFNNSTYVSKTPLELIFTDVWGPTSVSPLLVLAIMPAFLIITQNFYGYFQ